jgi:hypothetical protein
MRNSDNQNIVTVPPDRNRRSSCIPPCDNAAPDTAPMQTTHPEQNRSAEQQTAPPDQLEQGKACFVCLDGPPNAVLLECGHGGLCAACAERLWQGRRSCPLCRAGFAGVVRIVGVERSTVQAHRQEQEVVRRPLARRRVWSVAADVQQLASGCSCLDSWLQLLRQPAAASRRWQQLADSIRQKTNSRSWLPVLAMGT